MATMAAVHSIQGLIQWVHGDEWRDAFEEVFDQHIGRACDKAGVDPTERAEIIGDSGALNLWGCAFEDFVSSGPDDRNLAIDYLKHRGRQESAGARAYIRALRRSTMSLYEVSDVVLDQSFLARDLIRGGEPVRVFERSATRGLKQWDRIATRVVTLLGKTQITGAVLVFNHQLADEALAAVERLRKKVRANAVKLVRALGAEADEDALAAMTADDKVLAGAAFMFSTLWLDDVLGRALNPTRPEMQNTDGEPIEFITLHFPFEAQAKLPAIRAALDALPALSKESDSFWNWLAPAKAARAAPAQAAATAQTMAVSMDDGATVLGNVEIGAKAVTLSVNSEGRASRGQAMLEAALAGLVRTPLAERQTVEQMMAAAPPQGERASVAQPLPPHEVREVLHQLLTDHYLSTLDQPLPALGDRSPRRAVKTAKGRDQVIAWLKLLENHSGRRDPDDPMSSYDFAWMWEELGVSEYRR